MTRRLIALGAREIDLDRAVVRCGAESTPLTANEVRLLEVLSARPGEMYDRDQLLCEALGYRAGIVTRAVDQAIWRLRRKLEEDPHSPRFLLSTANEGYRLVLEATPPPIAIGRGGELKRAEQLLERHGSLIVVGLPGSGRRTLVRALAERGGRCVVASRMPDEQHAPVVRLGPLEPAQAQELLVSSVLAARGAGALQVGEDEHVAEVAARAGHHPGTLVALARRATLHRLSDLGPTPTDPTISLHLEALSPAARGAVAIAAWFPDRFSAADAVRLGATAEGVEDAWRACALDLVSDGGLVVPAAIRAVTVPDPAARSAFVQSVVDEVTPWARSALDTTTLDALEHVRARAGRIRAALAVDPSCGRRLLASFVVLANLDRRMIPADLPPSGPDDDADDQIGHALLWAWKVERGDRHLAVEWADRVLPLVAVASPGMATLLLRQLVRFRSNVAVAEDALLPLVLAAGGVADRSGEPVARATFVHVRAMAHLRGGRFDEAREDLSTALREYGPGSFMARVVASTLAAEAGRDGRAHEALAWNERATSVSPVRSREGLPLPPIAPDESEDRVRRAWLLFAIGDCEGAVREVTLAEMLGTSDRNAETLRAIAAVLDRRPGPAAARAESARTRPIVPGVAPIAASMVLGWVRVVQGLDAAALALADEMAAQNLISNAEYVAQVVLLRAAADARGGRPVEARARLAETCPPTGRWWLGAKSVVEALIARSEGAEIDVPAVRREVTQGRFHHVVTRFALAALEADP